MGGLSELYRDVEGGFVGAEELGAGTSGSVVLREVGRDAEARLDRVQRIAAGHRLLQPPRERIRRERASRWRGNCSRGSASSIL